MKKTLDYNNGAPLKKLTDALKLKKGDIKIFKIIGIKQDPDYPERLKIPTCVIVPTRDTIMVGNDSVDIACIRSIGAKRNPIFADILFRKESGGTITIRGGDPTDQIKYEYMMLCNYNGSNLNRDKSKRILFTLLDPIAKANTARAGRLERLKAVEFAVEMNDSQVETFASASGWNIIDIGITRDKIEEMAEKYPTQFLKIANNRQNNIKADVKRALDAGYINFDRVTSSFTWNANDEVITTVPRSTKGTHLDGMLAFVLNSEHGLAVYDEIKMLLNSDNEDTGYVAGEVPASAKTVTPNPKKNAGKGDDKVEPVATKK